ncbi:hypothetical protein U1Q18_044080 [Sarracenia purpurea var. burkii]
MTTDLDMDPPMPKCRTSQMCCGGGAVASPEWWRRAGEAKPAVLGAEGGGGRRLRQRSSGGARRRGTTNGKHKAGRHNTGERWPVLVRRSGAGSHWKRSHRVRTELPPSYRVG